MRSGRSTLALTHRRVIAAVPEGTAARLRPALRVLPGWPRARAMASFRGAFAHCPLRFPRCDVGISFGRSAEGGTSAGPSERPFRFPGCDVGIISSVFEVGGISQPVPAAPTLPGPLGRRDRVRLQHATPAVVNDVE